MFGGACDTGISPGILAEIRDAQSGAPLADSAHGHATDGAFSDSLRPYSGLALHAADERSGTYSLFVTRPGYATWSASGIRVSRGRCHVSTANITVRMDRAP